jgi:DnaK suppressor protein
MTHYTRTQSASLAHLLGKMDSDLRDEVRTALLQSGEQKYIDLAGQVHDRGDESVADELVAVDNALLGRHVHELRAIEVARERLARGTIDECIDCSGEIGFKRMMANPLAVRCIECQDRFDRTHAHEASPRM